MPSITITSDSIDFNAVLMALRSPADTAIEIPVKDNPSDYILIYTRYSEFVGYKPQRHICMSYVERDESVASEYFKIDHTIMAISALQTRYNSDKPWLPTDISDPFDVVFEKI